MNIFDIIGPIMIGPSSSHTAGAAKIGNIAQKILGSVPVKAKITLYGSFADTGKGHGTDKALLAGICGYPPDDIRIRNIFDECPIEYSFSYDENADYHPNTARIELTDGETVTNVRGASIGGGRVEIQEIDGMEVSFSGNYNTLIVFHQDRKGFLGEITTWLGENGINIAFMNLNRQEKGDMAVTVIETDQKVIDSSFLKNFRGCIRVGYYERK